MLQLQAKTINICRISKLLVKYNIKASISNSVITLSGDISDELLTKLCGSITINAVQNFISDVSTETTSTKSAEKIMTEVVENPSEVETTKVEEAPEVDTTQPFNTLPNDPSEYDLIYSEVKRGEVYLCDFGEPYEHEQGFIRYAIVVQNDDRNLYNHTTIVIPCTTKKKKWTAKNIHCTFSSRNMIDYDLIRVGSKENVIKTEQIRTVDKKRLRKYIGTLTPYFMKMIEREIDITLNLCRKPVNDEKSIINHSDMNQVQVKLLSRVDTNELTRISQSTSPREIKAQEILSLFGFDFQKNGVQYLLKAIIASPPNEYFNLETLSEIISQDESIDKEEIKRLIVARVKENFGFRKAPTIDFIRLVNYLVQEDNQ